MRVTNNFINQIINNKRNLKELQNFKSEVPVNRELPSAHTIGASMVNSNLPISYTKIGEIEIPGLKDKASVFKLANGQRVVIAPKQGRTMVKTSYNVGSMNETDDIRGMSHFIEHNLFNGSKDLAPREYDKRVSDLGGKTNANTSYATTNYFLDLQLLQENSLEEAIKLNALQTQFPTFSLEQLEKEKEPVKSEIDLYKDVPSDNTHSQVLKDLFGINTASDNFILGTKDNINAMTQEKVLDYYNTWYTPDNAVTVITGDIDINETMALVSKYYNKQNNYANVNKRHDEPIKYNDKPVRRDFTSPNATKPHISMGFALPEGTSNADNEKIDLICEMLQAPNSNLSKRMDKIGAKFYIEEEKMQNKPNGAKAKIIEIDTSEENIEEALKIIYEEITNISNNPPSVQDIETIKNKRINYINSTTEQSYEINYALSEALLNNDYDYWNNKINNIKSINRSDISETAKKFFDLNKTAISAAHEKNSAIAKSSNNISFGKSINPANVIENETNKIKEFRLQNNIETMIIQGNQYAKAPVFIDFNTDELNGVSRSAFELLTSMLNRGSALTNKETFDDIKLQKDININFFVNNNGLFVNASSYDDNLKDSLSLIKEVLSNPNFSQADFEAEKQKLRNDILAEELSPINKIEEEFFNSSRCFVSKEQRLKELDAMTLDDIKNLYSLILSTSKVNASLTAPVEEKPYLQDIFNNELSTGMGTYIPYTKEKSASYYTYTPNLIPKTIVQADEVKQAKVAQAYKFKKSENINDIAKIEVLNVLLGGSMSSRLFTDLRENQKLAYSVESMINENKDTQAMILYISTTTESQDPKEGSPENITKALNGFQNNINLLKTQNVSNEELNQVKTLIKTNILNNMETNMAKANRFSDAKQSVYDVAYVKELFKVIDALTPDDIRAAANYVFKDAPLTSIVASQNTLNALNLK